MFLLLVVTVWLCRFFWTRVLNEIGSVLGAIVMGGSAFAAIILLCMALFNGDRLSEKQVILTKVTSTSSSIGLEVELQGVNLSRGDESFTCSSPELAQRCAQLHVGDQVVITRSYNELGFANPAQISFDK
ncbi:MAG: hypothetical protein WBP12_05575 [Candidatus Saccharimonas sp.]